MPIGVSARISACRLSALAGRASGTSSGVSQLPWGRFRLAPCWLQFTYSGKHGITSTPFHPNTKKPGSANASGLCWFLLGSRFSKRNPGISPAFH